MSICLISIKIDFLRNCAEIYEIWLQIWSFPLLFIHHGRPKIFRAQAINSSACSWISIKKNRKRWRLVKRKQRMQMSRTTTVVSDWKLVHLSGWTAKSTQILVRSCVKQSPWEPRMRSALLTAPARTWPWDLLSSSGDIPSGFRGVTLLRITRMNSVCYLCNA